MLTEGLGSDSSPEIERDAPSTGGLKLRALLVRSEQSFSHLLTGIGEVDETRPFVDGVSPPFDQMTGFKPVDQSHGPSMGKTKPAS